MTTNTKVFLHLSRCVDFDKRSTLEFFVYERCRSNVSVLEKKINFSSDVAFGN